MATTKDKVSSLYKRILIPLGIIYTKYIGDERGPESPPARPKFPNHGRQFSTIPLQFGDIMGGQLGIFLGDLNSERYIWPTYGIDKPAVIINVERVNEYAPDIDASGVCVLLAHELGHAFRWYLGHSGGETGYTNEPWARSLEIAYIEALQTSIHASQLGVSFDDSVEFIKQYRKTLYKSTLYEKSAYSALTGDEEWPASTTTRAITCPRGDPKCYHPIPKMMFHKTCTPPQ